MGPMENETCRSSKQFKLLSSAQKPKPNFGRCLDTSHEFQDMIAKLFRWLDQSDSVGRLTFAKAVMKCEVSCF